jgi:ABC-2 type transport system ATP-binding protein
MSGSTKDQELPPSIKTVGLVKSYGKFEAVKGLDLLVPAGIVYGLIGPNGSGKTTTVKMLCGLIRPTKGAAYIFGKRVPDESPREVVGYMPQETGLYLDLTVHQNMKLFGRIFDMPSKEFETREKELLSFIELRDWKDSLVSNLSGGMRKRVSLVCSLLHRPKLLLLDEPTVGVDPELRSSFWSYFHDLGKEGITIVITTHYMEEASRCDRIGLMRNGEMLSEGEPRMILERTGTGSLDEAFLKLARMEAVR